MIEHIDIAEPVHTHISSSCIRLFDPFVTRISISKVIVASTAPTVSKDFKNDLGYPTVSSRLFRASTLGMFQVPTGKSTLRRPSSPGQPEQRQILHSLGLLNRSST